MLSMSTPYPISPHCPVPSRSIDEYGEGSGQFHWIGLFRSIGSFVGIFFGSFVLGVAMGLVTALLMKFSKLRDHPLLETSMFVIMSYSTFVLAEFCQLTGEGVRAKCGAKGISGSN